MDGSGSVIATAAHAAYDGLKFVWFALMGLIVWNGKRLVKKVDDLEKNTVETDTFNQTLGSLRRDIHELGEKQENLHKNLRDDTRSDIKDVHERIDKMMDK